MQSISTILLSLFLFIFIMLYIAGIILKLKRVEEMVDEIKINMNEIKKNAEYKKHATNWTIDQLIKRIDFIEKIINEKGNKWK